MPGPQRTRGLMDLKGLASATGFSTISSYHIISKPSSSRGTCSLQEGNQRNDISYLFWLF